MIISDGQWWSYKILRPMRFVNPESSLNTRLGNYCADVIIISANYTQKWL